MFKKTINITKKCIEYQDFPYSSQLKYIIMWTKKFSIHLTDSACAVHIKILHYRAEITSKRTKPLTNASVVFNINIINNFALDENEKYMD